MTVTRSVLFGESYKEVNDMFTTLETLRLRALALRSSIHNEQCLSALELAGMCAKKTNEVICVVNDLCEFTEKLSSALKVEYNEETEELTIGGI